MSFWDNDATEDAGPQTNSSGAHGTGRGSGPGVADCQGKTEGSGEDTASGEEEEDESSEESAGSGSEDGAPDVSAVRRRPTDDVRPGNRCRHLSGPGRRLPLTVFRILVGTCTVSIPQLYCGRQNNDNMLMQTIIYSLRFGTKWSNISMFFRISETPGC